MRARPCRSLRRASREAGDVGRVVLAVGVEKHQHFAFRGPGAGLDRWSIAEALRVRDDPGALRFIQRGGFIGRAVVDDDNFGLGKIAASPADNLANGRGFVLGWNDDGKLQFSPLCRVKDT